MSYNRTLLISVALLGTIGLVAAEHGDNRNVDKDLYSFVLHPTRRAPRAAGIGNLKLVWSPFGLSLTSEGYVRYDLTVTVNGLPPAGRLPEGAGYVAWIASPNLRRVERLNEIHPGEDITTRLDSWNKFAILVTLERDPGSATAPTGPVVLRGSSPSGLMESFQSHELFTDVPD